VDEGHILKRKYWRLWPKEKPPECLFTFTMYDTAFTEKTVNDKSARTTWGVFEHKEREGERPSLHMILLEAWDDHIDARIWKREVMIGQWGGKETREALKEDLPHEPEKWQDIDVKRARHAADRILIENKASGIWLIRELRRIKKPKALPVHPWLGPARLGRQGVGQVRPRPLWLPGHGAGRGLVHERKWATDTIDKCAACQFLGNDADADLADHRGGVHDLCPPDLPTKRCASQT
jgi:hypothetical protein